MTRDVDVTRAGVPFVAAGITAFACVTDPGGWPGAALLGVAAATFAVWAWWPRFPMLALVAGVLVPVVLAKRSGDFDGAMLLVSLLAVAVAGWEDSSLLAAGTGLVAVGSPLLVAALQPPNAFGWGLWMVGIAFPWLMTRAFHRQEKLAAELQRTRQELAERALSEERRRIARDVHDLVGHGLAAAMVRSAEEVGRRSLQELRRTVALLRSDGEDPAAPVPGVAEIADLVGAARSNGLTVEFHAGHHDADGSGGAPSQAAGLALYRIAQESLANALRHAPRARTVVTTAAEDGWITLYVDSDGPLGERHDEAGGDRPRYGLAGMRERAQAAGGEFEAGPVSGGWRLRCRIPLDDAPSRPASGKAAAR